MPYLIDGHNLIPKVGLRLESVDDELELLQLLQRFGRRGRVKMEVFFDGAPTSGATTRKMGRITATFVSHSSTADEAIRQRLLRLGREARNWTVVTSDREVLAAATAAHARTKRAEAFAAEVLADIASARKEQRTGTAGGRDGGLSDTEIQEWLDLFKSRGQ